MKLTEFLLDESFVIYFYHGPFQESAYYPRTRIVCHDGFSISVQAGSLANSTPRDGKVGTVYSTVEIGFPSECSKAEGMIDEFGIAGYVPVEEVQELLDLHGGIDVEATMAQKRKVMGEL